VEDFTGNGEEVRSGSIHVYLEVGSWSRLSREERQNITGRAFVRHGIQ